MKRQAPLALLLLPLLLLGACADDMNDTSSDAEPVLSDGPQTISADDLKPWLGNWSVTEVYASTQLDRPETASAGQRLFLSGTTATDIAGRNCTRASYQGDQLSQAAFLGLSDDESQDASRTQPRPHLTVACGHSSFGQYLLLDDNSMLALTDGKALKLVRQGEMHVLSDAKPAVEQAPVPAPAATGKPTPLTAADAAPPPPMAGKPGPALYLASYRDKPSALHGWKELTQSAPMLAKAEPEMADITVHGKSFLRLSAKGLTREETLQVCRSLISILPKCGIKMPE